MKIKGNDIIVFFYVSNAWRTLAYGLTCEIDISAEVIKVSNPKSGRFPKSKKKRVSWAGSSAHLMSDELGAVDIKKLIKTDTPIKILMGSVESHKDDINFEQYVPDGRFFFSGDALVTRLTITGNKGTSCSLSLEFTGSGEPDWRDWNEVIMAQQKLLHDNNSNVYNVIR